MSISSVNKFNVNPQPPKVDGPVAEKAKPKAEPTAKVETKKDTVSFGNKQKYENPVSKGWEYFSASIGPVIGSGIVGTAVGFALKYTKASKVLKVASGIAAGVVTLGLTLPSALYRAKQHVFVKEKEMDVYSRTKSVETGLSEQIDDQVRDKDIPLEKSLDNYVKMQMGKKGNAVGIVGM